MPTFNTQIIRIAADTTSKESVLDLNTSAEPEAWWARNLTVQVGVFAGAVLLDVSDVQSVVLYLKDLTNLDGGALVAKTITTFDNTTTLATWQAGTQQHFVVAFSADDLSFSLSSAVSAGAAPSRLVHLSIVAITTAGQTATICVGTLNLIDDGGNSPSSNPANAITVTQAQAMVAALAWAAAVLNLNAAGTSNITNAQSWLQGIQPVSLAAGAGAYVANLVLLPANALAGARVAIPIDFTSANPTLNIFDTSTGGALLQGPLVNPNPAQVSSFLFEAYFNGANWVKLNGQWLD